MRKEEFVKMMRHMYTNIVDEIKNPKEKLSD